MKAFLIVGVTLLLLGAVQTLSAAPQKNVMFILDASNSMWGQIDGKAKIEIAKDVLGDLVKKMPKDVKMGLISYGHRFARKLKDCDDLELINPVGHLTAKEVDYSLGLITPKGQTPIAQTLLESQNWLADYKGQKNTVVLISDGVESCDGDPCAAAKAIAAAGITAKIHVVGFDLTAKQRKKMQCIADNGNGKYFDAKNAKSLTMAMNEVQKDIATSPKTIIAPSKPVANPVLAPVPTKFFEDGFDGEDLTDGWDVINPNPDRYVVDSGELIMIAGTPAGAPSQKNMENIITHDKALPKGDWEIEVDFKIEMQQGSEAFYFGVMNDHKGWMAAGLKANLGRGEVSINSFIAKNESGKLARFDSPVAKSRDTNARKTTKRWKKHGLGGFYKDKNFVITLRKTGRSYTVSGTYSKPGDKDFRKFKTERLKMLRGKKKLFLAFGLAQVSRKHQGEGNLIVNKVTVRKIK